MHRSWILLFLCCAAAPLSHAAAVSSSDLAGTTYESRACENLGGLAFVTRSYSFSASSYTLDLTFHATSECMTETARLSSSGSLSLLETSATQVPYTTVTLTDLGIATKTLTPLVDDLTLFYNSLTTCWPSDTFTTGVTTDILSFSCPILGIESASQCPDGERNIIAFYNDALFFGDSTQGSLCALPRPTLLSTHGLVPAGSGSDILAITRTLSHQNQVNSLLGNIDMDNVMQTIADLSSYFTRYFSTDTGAMAAQDLLALYREAASCNVGNVEVEEFRNSDIEGSTYKQSSIIGRIRGSVAGPAGEALVIVGGHIDSANFFDSQGQSTFVDDGSENPLWFTQAAPGADDDLSGSAVTLELFRVLVAAGFQPERTIEFHGYAGEERGLVDGVIKGKSGSELIARRLRNQGKEVAAQMNFDSIGNPFTGDQSCNPLGANLNSLVVFGDPATSQGNNLDPSIRDLFVNCVNEYSEEPYVAQLGPNGQSDHLSFVGNGYKAGGAVESNIGVNLGICDFEKQIHHTANDTFEKVDRDYLFQFARAGLGYLIEASKVPGSSSSSVSFSAPSCSSPSVSESSFSMSTVTNTGGSVTASSRSPPSDSSSSSKSSSSGSSSTSSTSSTSSDATVSANPTLGIVIAMCLYFLAM